MIINPLLAWQNSDRRNTFVLVLCLIISIATEDIDEPLDYLW